MASYPGEISREKEKVTKSEGKHSSDNFLLHESYNM